MISFDKIFIKIKILPPPQTNGCFRGVNVNESRIALTDCLIQREALCFQNINTTSLEHIKVFAEKVQLPSSEGGSDLKLKTDNSSQMDVAENVICSAVYS